jgi:NADH dehydrogenase
VIGVESGSVRVVCEGVEEAIATRTKLWAAGVQASSFVRRVEEATGAQTDRAGRIMVEPDLTVPGDPEIIGLGDAAAVPWRTDRTVPGVAQGAIQAGGWVGRALLTRLDGSTPKSFRYTDKGDVAVIGRLRGVTNIPWLGPLGRQGGFIAWAMWLAIHIFYLIGFTNRIVVMLRWGWSFFTSGRGTRLITGSPQLPPIEEPAPPASSSTVVPADDTGQDGSTSDYRR